MALAQAIGLPPVVARKADVKYGELERSALCCLLREVGTTMQEQQPHRQNAACKRYATHLQEAILQACARPDNRAGFFICASMAFIICAVLPGGRSEAEARPPPGFLLGGCL